MVTVDAGVRGFLADHGNYAAPACCIVDEAGVDGGAADE